VYFIHLTTLITQYIVRYSAIYCDDFEPEFTDSVFSTRKAAEAYLCQAFDECDDVSLFTREVSDEPLPF
jgi:hypothetical protein